MELVKCPVLRGGGGTSREMYTLQHLVTQYRGFIAGGYARWALSPLQSPAPPSDIDCYFRDVDGMQEFSYAIGRSGWHVTGNSAFAVRFTKAYFDLPIHAICVTGTPGLILDSMDLGICQAAIERCEGQATHSFIEEETKKVLRIVKPHSLQLTMKRIMKYMERGYTISEEEMDRLFQFFAVRYLGPVESPFANYQILGVERAEALDSRPGSFIETSPPIDWSRLRTVAPSMSPAEYNAMRERQESQGAGPTAPPPGYEPAPRPGGLTVAEEVTRLRARVRPLLRRRLMAEDEPVLAPRVQPSRLERAREDVELEAETEERLYGGPRQ